MATTSQHAQNFLAKNQTNEALPLAKFLTMKETITLPRDLHEIYADNTVTYAGYEEECVRYHGLSIDNIRPMDWKHITCAHIICDRILENSSKSHTKSSVFLHVFNDISTCVYVFTEYFLHGFSNLSIEFYVVL